MQEAILVACAVAGIVAATLLRKYTTTSEKTLLRTERRVLLGSIAVLKDNQNADSRLLAEYQNRLNDVDAQLANGAKMDGTDPVKEAESEGRGLDGTDPVKEAESEGRGLDGTDPVKEAESEGRGLDGTDPVKEAESEGRGLDGTDPVKEAESEGRGLDGTDPVKEAESEGRGLDGTDPVKEAESEGRGLDGTDPVKEAESEGRGLDGTKLYNTNSKQQNPIDKDEDWEKVKKDITTALSKLKREEIE